MEGTVVTWDASCVAHSPNMLEVNTPVIRDMESISCQVSILRGTCVPDTGKGSGLASVRKPPTRLAET